MGKYTHSSVSFEREGQQRAGFLYLPARPRPAPTPCVVLCAGFGSTMDRLFDHAAAFAEAGFAALVFDYGSFGASGGEPRQVVDVDGQLADVRAAIAFVRDRPEVDADRVLLWGNSLGGAHAITVAADDPRIAAVVAQIPFNGFPRRVEGRSAWHTLRMFRAIVWDALRGRIGLRPAYIPLVAGPGKVAITNAPEAERHIAKLSAGHTLWRNQTAPRAVLRMMRYRPAESAARLTVPLLVCVATADQETPEELTRALAERAPRGHLRRYPGTHFTFYDDPDTRRAVLADQIAFYRDAGGWVGS